MHSDLWSWAAYFTQHPLEFALFVPFRKAEGPDRAMLIML